MSRTRAETLFGTLLAVSSVTWADKRLGQLADSTGWDTQLIARRAGTGEAPLDVNEQVEDTDEYIQLWRNTTKPPAPFNLTPYALTLNDIPKGLEEYLAPTDCRLRTDQRAFENAEYDKAQM